MKDVDPFTQARTEIEYLDKLARELTDGVRRDVYRFALRFCYGLARAGVRVDSDLPKNLVADAISDTASSERRWDSERCTLTQHLRGVVRSRVWDLREHAMRFPKVSIATDDGGDGVTVADRQNMDRATLLRDLARRVFQPLYARATANEDEPVTRLLDAYSIGVVNRAEVAQHAGFTVKDYDRARDRLSRMIAALPEDVRHAVADTFGGMR